MDSEENLKAFVCAVGNDNHFVVERPVTLMCSHACCLSCIESYKQSNFENGNYKIKCGVCNKENKIDYDVISESIFVKHFITLNCRQLFQAIRDKYQQSLENLKGENWLALN